ncbi:GNAT family N-acetyltransferase [Pseudomonas sp. TH32]|uniref:GNAT family N-acetyltransferase n=1 Tax=Pseudomonas sp. TH32 TaxID=2796397 RepID=UPI001913985F|nr:GNAT family N-acetyltransferase [Pseudomonas sp. TH32]MBK5438289.1 GNAT family N-acetyltransferase [Pseudomonas sp. TH32]
MALRLRPACVTDLPSIYRGEQDYIRRWEPGHEEAWRLQLERHLTCWVENFDRLTVAIIEEQFAGYCLWTPEQDCAELCTINVSEAYRRRGIGQALVDAYAVAARQHGFTCLRLSVRPDNPARLLYERAGFVCVGSGANDYLRYESQG